MLEILTPLAKVERVSRSIDPSTFVAQPGMWAYLETDGSLVNIITGTNKKINKLVIGSASSSIYESHDVEVGRISTMESFGIRCKVDSVGYSGSMYVGDYLVVSSEAGKEGKLVSIGHSAVGTYEIVARVEEVNTSLGYIVFRTVSPSMEANASSASASMSPSSSASASISPSGSASGSASPSSSTSASVSPSGSVSVSVSPSASTSPSASASPS